MPSPYVCSHGHKIHMRRNLDLAGETMTHAWWMRGDVSTAFQAKLPISQVPMDERWGGEQPLPSTG